VTDSTHTFSSYRWLVISIIAGKVTHKRYATKLRAAAKMAKVVAQSGTALLYEIKLIDATNEQYGDLTFHRLRKGKPNG